MFYPGQKVKYGSLPEVYMLDTLVFPEMWSYQNKDGLKGPGAFYEKALTPVFKAGDTVEAIVKTAPMIDGIYLLIEAKTGAIDTHCWDCVNQKTGKQLLINETWLWPWPPQTAKPNSCTCDIMALMAYGCKCGQMAREKS